VRAWWAYWLTFAVGAAVWIGVAVAKPGGTMRDALHQPVWLFLLLAPLVAAGGNLIVFRRSHEEICRLEVERHRWLWFVVGAGYSAATFAFTGFALLALVAAILIGLVI
jgi:hypothetical protein